MDHFAGLDVSVKETSVCIVDNTGRIVREVKVPDVYKRQSPACASSFRKATRKSGAERGRRRATSSIGSEMSTPTTEPVGRTRSARASEVWPHPQPMSTICSPSPGQSASMAASPNGST